MTLPMNNNLDKLICMNCDEPISYEDGGKLFCSELCQQEAKFVRYVRNCIKDGRIKNADIKRAINIKLVKLVSGGYPQKKRKIPLATRKSVIKRDHGICKICGQPGTEIDHIAGSSNDISNLQLLCNRCHLEKTEANFVKVSPGDENYERIKQIHNRLSKRVNAKKPLRLCDDETNWDSLWRKMLSERKEFIKTRNS